MNLAAIIIQESLIIKFLIGFLAVWGIRAIVIVGFLGFLYLKFGRRCH
ncbi:hypothetical protein ABUE38_00315 [Pediococcus parvulus]